MVRYPTHRLKQLSRFLVALGRTARCELASHPRPLTLVRLLPRRWR